MDQGTDKDGKPADGFMPGAEVRAALTVVGDGPVGAIGQQLDQSLGLPEGHALRDWAVGMKFVVELPAGYHACPRDGPPHPRFSRARDLRIPLCASGSDRVAGDLCAVVVRQPGADGLPLPAALDAASLSVASSEGRQTPVLGRQDPPGIGTPRRTAPVGNGYARIGEGSGSTNVLTGSGVDEAWTTGVQLGESVLELLSAGKNRSRARTSKRPTCDGAGPVGSNSEGRVAEKSRDGFHRGVVTGLIGMALTGMTGGRFFLRGKPFLPHERFQSLERFYRGKLSARASARSRRIAARAEFRRTRH
jgi:electron-transferring-flavoprotein dehydrogenase